MCSFLTKETNMCVTFKFKRLPEAVCGGKSEEDEGDRRFGVDIMEPMCERARKL